MRILLSNDDGYLAPGLAQLAGSLDGLGEIIVVAPERNRSGASNSLTLDLPLHLGKAANGHMFVSGTPTDCVHLAVTGLLDPQPDMVVSGINAGANLGDDTLYSGTVAAAMEGFLFGVPAIAFSQAEKGWGHVKGAWHSMWGDDKQAAADVEAGNAKSDQTEAESEARQKAVTAFTHEWQATATSLQSGSLSSLLKFVTDTSAGLKLSKLAKMIPIVGDDAAKLVEEAVTAVKEFLREKLEAAFHSCMLQLTAEINAALAAALGSSEVHDKTGASSMTQPTHTDIAKDFKDDQNGTEDRFSIIEEVGEFFHRVGGAKKAGQILVDKAKARFDAVMSKKTGVIEGLKGAANDLSEEINGPASEEGTHKHQHRHDGAWLAPLADTLAHSSSNAILAAYKPQLDQAKTGKAYDMSTVTATVMKYYQHPADCQGLWQGPFMSVLNGQIAGRSAGEGQKMAHHIKEELAHRIARPPMEQAANDQHTTGGENRHGEQDKGDNNHGKGQPGHTYSDADDNHDHDHDNHPHGAHTH